MPIFARPRLTFPLFWDNIYPIAPRRRSTSTGSAAGQRKTPLAESVSRTGSREDGSKRPRILFAQYGLDLAAASAGMETSTARSPYQEQFEGGFAAEHGWHHEKHMLSSRGYGTRAFSFTIKAQIFNPVFSLSNSPYSSIQT